MEPISTGIAVMLRCRWMVSIDRKCPRKSIYGAGNDYTMRNGTTYRDSLINYTQTVYIAKSDIF